MNTPIIIPITHTVEVPTCPQCGQPLKKPGPPLTFKDHLVILGMLILLIAGGAIFLIEVMTIIVDWTMTDHTLVEVLANHLQWYAKLLGRIW